MSGRSYLSIGDVLTLLRQEFPDVTISKIRFLESQGLVNPERSPSGYRKFYDHDVERLRWVLRQQREHFLPLKVIRDRLDQENGRIPDDDLVVGAVAAEVPADVVVAEVVAPPPRAVVAHPAPAPDEAPALATTGTAEAVPVPTPGASNGAAPHGPVAATNGANGSADLAAPEPALASAAAPGPTAASAPEGPARASAAGPPAEPPAPAPSAPVPSRAHAPRPPTSAPTPGPTPTEPAPVERSRVAAAQGRSAEAPGSGFSVHAGLTGASLTADELCSASGLSATDLATLEGFGLLEPTVVAGVLYYDEEALTVAQLVAEFATYGIEPRHLRLYRNAVDREVGLVEQIVTPLLRQRNPEARQRALDTAADLGRLGQSLRASLLRKELRRQLGS